MGTRSQPPPLLSWLGGAWRCPCEPYGEQAPEPGESPPGWHRSCARGLLALSPPSQNVAPPPPPCHSKDGMSPSRSKSLVCKVLVVELGSGLPCTLIPYTTPKPSRSPLQSPCSFLPLYQTCEQTCGPPSCPTSQEGGRGVGGKDKPAQTKDGNQHESMSQQGIGIRRKPGI